MKSKTGPILIVLLILLLILLGVLTGGALDVVKRGGGFLFVPSFTPTATLGLGGVSSLLPPNNRFKNISIIALILFGYRL